MISPAGAGGREVCVEVLYRDIGPNRESVDFDRALFVVADGDPHSHHLFGQQLFDLLGPFDQTEIPGVEIFFVAEVVSLFEPVDPVEIEVIDILPFAGRILIDDGESGTCHCVVGSEPGDDFPDQGGLPAPFRRGKRRPSVLRARL